MGEGFILTAGTALWLGILTSISPCPLTTNIAAVSYIGKNVDSNIKSLLSGLFYSLGRMIVYAGLSSIIVASFVSIPVLSMFLQTKINLILGPVLIITGLILTGIIRLNISGPGYSEHAQKLTQKGPYIGSLLIGFLFALAFCPVSAAIFFGSMLPMAVKQQSYLIVPAVYGIGTALPVIVFAVLLATGTRYAGIAFQKLTTIEIWTRKITGAVFIVAGVYFSLIYIFNIQLF